MATHGATPIMLEKLEVKLAQDERELKGRALLARLV
jgi:hypothetical protein